MKREKITVLIAEADRIQRSLMEDWLCRARNIDLCPSASNGLAGVETIYQCQPDVVVWDAFLPGLDALDLLGKLSVCPPLAWPKVIVTSWAHTAQMARTLFAAGASYLMEQPLNLSALEERIRMVAAPSDETPVEACLRLYDLPPGDGLPYDVCRSCIDYYWSAAQSGSVLMKQVEVDVSRQMNSTPDAVQKNLHRAILHIHKAGKPAFLRIWPWEKAPSNLVFLRRVTDDLKAHFCP